MPTKQQIAAFRELVRRAGEHVPIAYLIGKKEFFSLEFEISSATMIPRPETELLAQQVIEYCRSRARGRYDLFEMGTGSGCVAVAVCKYITNAHCVASDISVDALEVARRNVDRHGLSDRIRLVEADRLDLRAEVIPAEGFDVVFSNPPYVADSQWDALPETIRKFEPKLALAAGPEGLVFYDALADGAARILKPTGVVFVEIGHDQHERIKGIFERSAFEHVETWHDIGSRDERVMQFRATCPSQAPAQDTDRG